MQIAPLGVEPGVWDEMRLPDGGLRPAWGRFLQAQPEEPFAPGAGVTPSVQDRSGFNARRRDLQAQILRDGITHNVYGPEGAQPRPWSLELLPLLIEPGDWAVIESGVLQRAALLEAVVADVYGPQRLLQQGLLPAALVMRHPGYLRPLRGAVPPGGQHLRLVAFDIARGPDGQWWVLAQRTQGPSGLGYVLHNRLLVSRQFPQASESLRVQRLASSYRRLLDGLEEAAREVSGGASPTLALLTPGPYSETWFEHAYLARYLGLRLVEGSDLTVRAERLYMKTVEGLEPVHALLRRLDDDWCDPLELRADSALGVPGLVQCARAGRVAMANALGSAFLETPAVQGFLPALSQRLLGEPLRLPSLSTWWCGETAAWHAVRADRQDKLLRNTYPQAGRTSQVRDWDAIDVDEDPAAWTVQGRLRLSRAPVWSEQGLQSRPAMVRVYAIAGPGNRWHVLPGGMTRVARAEDDSVSMQRGGTSLDTWVMTEGHLDTFSMLPRALGVDDVTARRPVVGSRTAENLFWLGRYTERCEQQVRLARLALALCGGGLPPQASSASAVAQAVAALCLQSGLVGPSVPTPYQAPRIFERVVLEGLADAQGRYSVAFHLRALARSAQSLRERLSPEQWRLAQALGDAPVSLDRLEAMGKLDTVALQLAAMTGAQADRMTHDAGWRLLTVGRLLERLSGVSATLGAFVATTPELEALRCSEGVDALLELMDSTITFRARYQRREDLLALVELLVMDDTNPRSLAGVLRRARSEIAKLPQVHTAHSPSAGGPQLADGAPAAAPGRGLETLALGFGWEQLRGGDEPHVARTVLQACERLRSAALAQCDAIGLRHFTLADASEQALG